MKGWGVGPNLLLWWKRDTHKLEMVSLVHGSQSRVSGKMREMTAPHLIQSLMGTGGGGSGKEAKVVLA